MVSMETEQSSTLSLLATHPPSPIASWGPKGPLGPEPNLKFSALFLVPRSLCISAAVGGAAREHRGRELGRATITSSLPGKGTRPPLVALSSTFSKKWSPS